MALLLDLVLGGGGVGDLREKTIVEKKSRSSLMRGRVFENKKKEKHHNQPKPSNINWTEKRKKRETKKTRKETV